MPFIWKIVAMILSALMGVFTPSIKTELQKAIRALYQLALNTPNPADDLGVKFLADLIGVDLSGIVPTARDAVVSNFTIPVE